MNQLHEYNPAIVWFRQDLRLADNPALDHASKTAKPLLFLYIHDEVSEGIRPMGSAQKWWLHNSLKSLGRDISNLGGQLVLRSGPAPEIIANLAMEAGADAIYWNRRYGEGEQGVDRRIKTEFPGAAKSFGGLLLHEPSHVRTGSGQPYKVYTPFWKKLSKALVPRQPLTRPASFRSHACSIKSDDLDDWGLLPTSPDWSTGIASSWQPGENQAHKVLRNFLEHGIEKYHDQRDFPAMGGSSRLSPHLRFGEISPHQLWHVSYGVDGDVSNGRETWRKEVVWREFCYHLLQEWPDLASSNFNKAFDAFYWNDDPDSLKAWQQGQTGYPIVDAGMRQLYLTGWMHNRVRMIVASFLVKHLLIDWRHGERWFWDTLVDGDPASNPAQWQWVAGCGADAAPYFRIFNPILQAEKFDPEGRYVSQYVPELSRLPAKFLPAPWRAPPEVLSGAGVVLGETYPYPIVDHKKARDRALDALQAMRERPASTDQP